MKHEAGRSRRRPVGAGEEGGFLLLGTLVTILVGSILTGVLAEEWAVVEKREREAEYLFIQEEFALAILEFQKDQGRFPTELSELVENRGQKNQLFLRKEYKDPITRARSMDDWCLLQVGASGRVTSSCNDAGDPNQLGLGSNLRIGEEVGQPSTRRIQGLAVGASGLVGVHSRSSERAFNTLKRDDETYNRWYYTFDQYQKDMNARGIPGLSQGQGQTLGKGQKQPGQQPGRQRR